MNYKKMLNDKIVKFNGNKKAMINVLLEGKKIIENLFEYTFWGLCIIFELLDIEEEDRTNVLSFLPEEKYGKFGTQQMDS